MKIALLGYGKMGKTIEHLAEKAGHSVVYRSTIDSSEGKLDEADVALEFSAPEQAVANIVRCFEHRLPVVSGTTGWLDRSDEVLKKCESSNGSFLYASNFSIGVNLFFQLNEYVAQLMEPWKDYQVKIEEIHHTEKKDAPSGTAISVAEGIIKHLPKNKWHLDNGDDADSIPIRAERMDDVKGTHRVLYRSTIDTIKIEHQAHSRDGFALGALLAASWLIGKTGVYTMEDVLRLKNTNK